MPTPTLPGGELVRCASPEGFTLGRPAAWTSNDGDVVPACTQLHPEPFEVPMGTDERVAAITAFIDAVPFVDVAAPDPDREAERAATTIDGLQAVRLAFETGDDSLWPAGTPITLYAIDVSPGAGGRPGTLLLDTVGLPQFDYERNQVVLDRVARSVEVTLDEVSTAADVVARYEGGGGGFTVHGEVTGSQACLRIPPGGESACAGVPGDDELHTVELRDLGPVLAGVTGGEVFAVTAERRGGESSTFLPAPIGDTGTRGFAFTFGPGDVVRLRSYDVAGVELDTIQLGR